MSSSSVPKRWAADERVLVLDLVPDDEVEPLHGIGPLTSGLREAAEFFCIDPDSLEVAAEGSADNPGRTALALRTRARERWEARREAERRRLGEKEEKERRIRIDVLRTRGEDIWDEIEVEIERRIAQGYDRAMVLLSDLRVLAVQQGSHDAFTRRLPSIRARHQKKAKFIERLNKLG